MRVLDDKGKMCVCPHDYLDGRLASGAGGLFRFRYPYSIRCICYHQSFSCRNSTTAALKASGFSLMTQCPLSTSTSWNLGKKAPMVGRVSSAT